MSPCLDPFVAKGSYISFTSFHTHKYKENPDQANVLSRPGLENRKKNFQSPASATQAMTVHFCWCFLVQTPPAALLGLRNQPPYKAPSYLHVQN